MWSKKPDARRPFAAAIAVELELDVNLGLAGLAVDLRGTRHREPLSRMRASIESACSSNPSARAIGAASRASAAASSPIRTSATRRRKCAGDNDDANRAAPLVGSTWLEPAM